MNYFSKPFTDAIYLRAQKKPWGAGDVLALHPTA